ncbi:MAG: hypothetical protein PHW62_00060 [Candidatus Ratteibacteria bacterium]|nr:hypothetical protein [Candidatus Ratteibacteria bacterium]
MKIKPVLYVIVLIAAIGLSGCVQNPKIEQTVQIPELKQASASIKITEITDMLLSYDQRYVSSSDGRFKMLKSVGWFDPNSNYQQVTVYHDITSAGLSNQLHLYLSALDSPTVLSLSGNGLPANYGYMSTTFNNQKGSNQIRVYEVYIDYKVPETQPVPTGELYINAGENRLTINFGAPTSGFI